MRRRRALKHLAISVPMQPAAAFPYVLIVNRGILDGSVGWEYARMMRLFQEMIDLAQSSRLQVQAVSEGSNT